MTDSHDDNVEEILLAFAVEHEHDNATLSVISGSIPTLLTS